MGQDQEFIRLHGPVQLASAEVSCWKCHRQTPVHALVAADVEEFARGEEPMRIEEPFSQLDMRSAITHAMTVADDGKPTIGASKRPVLQYLGDLRRPRQIAFLHDGRRFIYDFRADRVHTWDGAQHTQTTLPPADRDTLQRLIHQWEWINLSLKRDSPRDGE